MPHSLLTLPKPASVWRQVALLVACLAGSSGAGTDRAAAEPVPGPAVRESAPEIFYMQDDAGRLVPVPGFRYRDFVDLLRLQEGLPGTPEPPAVVLENATARVELAPAGAAMAATEPPLPGGGDRVLARATVELTLRQTRGGWASLPVGLEGLLLSAPPRYEGAGQVLLEPMAIEGTALETTAAPPAGGYRLWVKGAVEPAADGTRHTIVLVGSLVVETAAAADSVTLRMPRATASLVEIR